jgi:hypothetical protein
LSVVKEKRKCMVDACFLLLPVDFRLEYIGGRLLIISIYLGGGTVLKCFFFIEISLG